MRGSNARQLMVKASKAERRLRRIGGLCYPIDSVSCSRRNVAMILNFTKPTDILRYNQRSVLGADSGHVYFNPLLLMC